MPLLPFSSYPEHQQTELSQKKLAVLIDADNTDRKSVL